VQEVHFARAQDDPAHYLRVSMWRSPEDWEEFQGGVAQQGFWAKVSEYLSEAPRFEFYDAIRSGSRTEVPTLSYPERRREVVEAVERLFRVGAVSHSGHANMSVRVGADRMLLTSNAVVRDLQQHELAVVGFDGRVDEGELESSTQEISVMHGALYQARPAIGAVVHTHSPHVAAFAVAGHALPCRYETLRRVGQVGDVPVVGWSPPGSDPLVGAIVEAVDRHPATTAVLLANHGLLAFAPTPAGAAMVVVALEEAAEAELSAATIGGSRAFPPGASGEAGPSPARIRR